MSREYPPRPILGVGVIIVREGRVLLVKRGREPSRGLFSIPGGGVKIGETLAEAALREAREETGLHVRLGPLVEVVERVTRDQEGKVRFHYVILDFLAEAEGEPAPGGDAEEVLWVETEHLSALPVTEGLEEVVRKALTLSPAPPESG